MSNLLYLVHRLPYPPNKGDKVRSYHLLAHLAARHSVFLGTFIDDPQDEAYADTLRDYCADLHIGRLSPRVARPPRPSCWAGRCCGRPRRPRSRPATAWPTT